jgi:hypothetical protein
MIKFGKVWSALAVGLVAVTLLTVTGLAWARNGDEPPLPQPDEDDYYVSAAADVNAGFFPTFSYVFVAGTTLRPRDSDTAWDYAGFGCVSASAGNKEFNVHLDIPEGSRIDYLRIFYYDTSASDSYAWITSYDGAGGIGEIAFVSSSGNSGYGSALSSFVGGVVDYHDNSYVLNWRPNQTGGSMRLCGLRVAYRLPGENIYLPVIIRD